MRTASGSGSIPSESVESKAAGVLPTAPQSGGSVFAEKCQWCNQEKVELPERTSKKGLPIFVCVKAQKGKSKTPCDGPAYELATRQD